MTPEWAAEEQRALDFIQFADGLEEAGMLTYAQRARVVANDALRAIRAARSEGKMRMSMQAQRDEARRLKIVRTPEEA